MSEFVSEPQPAAPPADPTPEPKPNPFARIAGVLFSPVETFASIARRPDWLVPLLLIVVVLSASTLVIAPRMDIEGMMREQFEGRKDMSREEVDSAIRMFRKLQPLTMVFQLVVPPIVVLVVTGVFFIALQMFGGEAKFPQILSVTAYGWMPILIQRILLTALIVPRAHLRPDKVAGLLKSNLAAFLPTGKNPALFTLFSMVDVFTIWSLILVIIGYAFASKLRRGMVAAIVLSVWIVSALVFAGIAGIGSMMQR